MLRIICIMGSDIVAKRQIASAMCAHLACISEDYTVLDLREIIAREMESNTRDIFKKESRVTVVNKTAVDMYRQSYLLLSDKYWAYKAISESSNIKASGRKNLILIGLETKEEHRYFQSIGCTMVLFGTDGDDDAINYTIDEDDDVDFWMTITCPREQIIELSQDFCDKYIREEPYLEVDEEIDIDDMGEDSDRWDDMFNDMGYA